MEICGRTYQVRRPIILHDRDKKKANNRVIVEGINHSNGNPIKFKSTVRAERHIRNMRLAKD